MLGRLHGSGARLLDRAPAIGRTAALLYPPLQAAGSMRSRAPRLVPAGGGVESHGVVHAALHQFTLQRGPCCKLHDASGRCGIAQGARPLGWRTAGVVSAGAELAGDCCSAPANAFPHTESASACMGGPWQPQRGCNCDGGLDGGPACSCKVHVGLQCAACACERDPNRSACTMRKCNAERLADNRAAEALA